LKDELKQRVKEIDHWKIKYNNLEKLLELNKQIHDYVKVSVKNNDGLKNDTFISKKDQNAFEISEMNRLKYKSIPNDNENKNENNNQIPYTNFTRRNNNNFSHSRSRSKSNSKDKKDLHQSTANGNALNNHFSKNKNTSKENNNNINVFKEHVNKFNEEINNRLISKNLLSKYIFN
jgi:hypothetical protein